MRYKLLPAIVLASVCAGAAPVWAQSSGSGTFGQRNLGSTLGGSSSSAFGGSSLGSSGSFGAGSGGMQQQNAGQITGSERYVRGARQPGQFVGGANDAGMVGQQNAAANGSSGMGMSGAGMMGRGGTGQLGGMFGNQGMNQLNRNMQNLQNLGRGQQQQRALRTPIRLGFDRPAVPGPQVTAQFEQRLTKIPQLQVTGPVKVKMDGSTAVLTGVVGSERDRDLAGRLALLEPGISDVRNELEIRPAPPVPAAETLPKPTAEVTPPVND